MKKRATFSQNTFKTHYHGVRHLPQGRQTIDVKLLFFIDLCLLFNKTKNTHGTVFLLASSAAMFNRQIPINVPLTGNRLGAQESASNMSHE